jgi:hypothetical protein
VGDFAGLATATLGLGGALVGTGLGALIGSLGPQADEAPY